MEGATFPPCRPRHAWRAQTAALGMHPLSVERQQRHLDGASDSGPRGLGAALLSFLGFSKHRFKPPSAKDARVVRSACRGTILEESPAHIHILGAQLGVWRQAFSVHFVKTDEINMCVQFPGTRGLSVRQTTPECPCSGPRFWPQVSRRLGKQRDCVCKRNPESPRDDGQLPDTNGGQRFLSTGSDGTRRRR